MPHRIMDSIACLCFLQTLVLCFNNAIACLHFNICLRDLIILPSIWVRLHNIHLVSNVDEMINIFNWRYQERYMRHQSDHYMAYSGAYEEQNGQQNSMPTYHDIDTNIPRAADGAARDMPNESNMEEDTKMGGLINSENRDVPLLNSNEEVDKNASRDDERVVVSITLLTRVLFGIFGLIK